MENQKNQNKEESLYEFYLKNRYQTAYVQSGRNFDTWSKEQKMTELQKLLKEFTRPSASSPREKTYDLINEIFNSSPIPASRIDGNLKEIMIEYCGWKDSVYECMKNDANLYCKSPRKVQEGPVSLAKMIEFFDKHSD